MFDLVPVIFWLVALAMLAIALAFVLPQLLSRSAPPTRLARGVLNAQAYRQAMIELERERDEGLIDEEGYRGARDELERRALAETCAEDAPRDPRATPRTALALAAALPLAAIVLYQWFGTPFALEEHAFAREADPDQYRASLAAHLSRRPGDARSWVLLARAELDADRFQAAIDAYEKALKLSPKVARDPDVLCDLADALGMVRGSLSGRPRDLIEQALALAPEHPRALEMSGSAAFEARDFAAAALTWRRLLAQMPPGGRRHAELAAAVDRAERLARFALPAARPASTTETAAR